MNTSKTKPVHMIEPFLVGDLVYLRPLRYEDLDGNYVHWLNNPEVCRYNSHHVFPYTREKAEEYIRYARSTKDALILAIVVKETGQHIGNASFVSIDRHNQQAEYAIIIGEKASHGRGYGTEATTLVFEHGFHSLNLHRIRAGVNAENTPSLSLFTRVGMKQEGVLEDAIFKNGRFHNIILFGMLKDVFMKKYPID